MVLNFDPFSKNAAAAVVAVALVDEYIREQNGDWILHSVFQKFHENKGDVYNYIDMNGCCQGSSMFCME
jgi:hypothetical protein